MSLANVLRKLKGEAKTKAANHGHTLGKFHQPFERDPTLVVAECSSCGSSARIKAAIEYGTHDVSGEAVALRCAHEN